jgi:hypothetical protein
MTIVVNPCNFAAPTRFSIEYVYKLQYLLKGKKLFLSKDYAKKCFCFHFIFYRNVIIELVFIPHLSHILLYIRSVIANKRYFTADHIIFAVNSYLFGPN